MEYADGFTQVFAIQGWGDSLTPRETCRYQPPVPDPHILRALHTPTDRRPTLERPTAG